MLFGSVGRGDNETMSIIGLCTKSVNSIDLADQLRNGCAKGSIIRRSLVIFKGVSRFPVADTARFQEYI